MCAPGEVPEHRARAVLTGRLRVYALSEVDGRVDAERDVAGLVHGPRLSERVLAHERHGVGVGWVVLDVAGLRELEGDPELLEDRPPLRRRRGEHEPRRHDGFAATQISSTGHFLDHAAENVT